MYFQAYFPKIVLLSLLLMYEISFRHVNGFWVMKVYINVRIYRQIEGKMSHYYCKTKEQINNRRPESSWFRDTRILYIVEPVGRGVTVKLLNKLG